MALAYVVLNKAMLAASIFSVSICLKSQDFRIAYNKDGRPSEL